MYLLHPFNGLFSRTTWVSWHQKGKTTLDVNEARDDGVLGCSDISWAICRQSAPCSRQITTPTPHHLIFTGCCPTNSVNALKASKYTNVPVLRIMCNADNTILEDNGTLPVDKTDKVLIYRWQ